MKIILFTASFPYGSGEAFVESELKVISRRVEEIVIIPLNINGFARSLHDMPNVKVVNIHTNDTRNTEVDLSLFAKMRILFNEWIHSNTGLQFLRYDLRMLRNAEILSKKLNVWLQSSETSGAVFYSFWFDEWASALAILKMSGLVPKYVCRAHGYDLYFDRHKRNQIPLRFFQMKHVTSLLAVSKIGRDYLIVRFPKLKDKIGYSYLGTSDYGLNKRPHINRFHIVSCSQVKSLKRVDDIFQIVEEIPNVHWTHIGDGDGFLALKKRVSASEHRSRVTLKGYMNHVDVMDYYAKNPITCFINLSESEGLPVSIMEAISFGIPIVATNVGGTSEIVNEQTGLLLPAYPTVNEARQLLVKMLEQISKGDFPSETIRDFWKKNFDAEHAYNKFLAKLLTM